MLIKIRQGWELPDAAATPEGVYLRRRELVKSIAAGSILAATGGTAARVARAAEGEDPSAHLYPVDRNDMYPQMGELTPEDAATTYNNFYEFGSHKRIHDAAQALPIRPWDVRIDGMVEREMTLGFDDLLAKMPLEERIYRHRCVEAWSMCVPWSGFPLQALVDLARPLGQAKYLRMETFENDEVASGQKQFWYPWPYVEGLTLAEATNQLAFIATGLYGKPIPKQNGAPLRLVVPWKYGFKCVKSIVRFTFTDERPVSFWEELQASEYGFWANVNPEVPHPRWSQASEKDIGTGERRETLLFNGYGEWVADLYAGEEFEGERLYM